MMLSLVSSENNLQSLYNQIYDLFSFILILKLNFLRWTVQVIFGLIWFCVCVCAHVCVWVCSIIEILYILIYIYMCI